MVFTWNGARFQFVTDILGVAPLGASSGDGPYFPVDHDEYIQIPQRALTPLDGDYQIRITEELREVTYIDQVKLIAVDHPEGMEIVLNEKFKSPPFPGFRLFGVQSRLYPVTALDDRGRDLASALRWSDGTYADTFRHNLAGVAEMHSLTLDFGTVAARNRAVLVLNGWVDWADGARSSSGTTGQWRTCIAVSAGAQQQGRIGRRWFRTWVSQPESPKR